MHNLFMASARFVLGKHISSVFGKNIIFILTLNPRRPPLRVGDYSRARILSGGRRHIFL